MSSKTKNATHRSIYPARWIPMDSGIPGETIDACSVCGRGRGTGHQPGCVGLTHGMAEESHESRVGPKEWRRELAIKDEMEKMRHTSHEMPCNGRDAVVVFCRENSHAAQSRTHEAQRYRPGPLGSWWLHACREG